MNSDTTATNSLGTAALVGSFCASTQASCTFSSQRLSGKGAKEPHALRSEPFIRSRAISVKPSSESTTMHSEGTRSHRGDELEAFVAHPETCIAVAARPNEQVGDSATVKRAHLSDTPKAHKSAGPRTGKPRSHAQIPCAAVRAVKNSRCPQEPVPFPSQ